MQDIEFSKGVISSVEKMIFSPLVLEKNVFAFGESCVHELDSRILDTFYWN